MKNILEGINSRLSDSEEQIGELEHSSGNHHHWAEKKEWKEIRTDTCGTMSSQLIFTLEGTQEEKRKGLRKYLKTVAETSLTWKRRESSKFSRCGVPYRISLKKNSAVTL